MESFPTSVQHVLSNLFTSFNTRGTSESSQWVEQAHPLWVLLLMIQKKKGQTHLKTTGFNLCEPWISTHWFLGNMACSCMWAFASKALDDDGLSSPLPVLWFVVSVMYLAFRELLVTHLCSVFMSWLEEQFKLFVRFHLIKCDVRPLCLSLCFYYELYVLP